MNLYRWVPANLRQHNFPIGACSVGTDVDGAKIYVGRAHHEGDVIPAKVIPSKNYCSVTYQGKIHVKEHFEVLVPTMLHWEVPKGHIPNGALEAGITANGDKLYYGRVYHQGYTIPGMVHPPHLCCKYTFGGEEKTSTEFEILTLTIATTETECKAL